MSALTIKQWNGQAVDVRQKLRSEWSKLCEKDGFLFSKKFLTLLTNAGYRRPNQMKRPGSASRQPDSFKPTEMDVEFALKQMGLSPYHIHDGVFLRYTTVVSRACRGLPAPAWPSCGEHRRAPCAAVGVTPHVPVARCPYRAGELVLGRGTR